MIISKGKWLQIKKKDKDEDKEEDKDKEEEKDKEEADNERDEVLTVTEQKREEEKSE